MERQSGVTSPTEVETLEACPRKWAFRWLEGIKVPRLGKSLGIDVHNLFAAWSLRGEQIDRKTEAGKIALAGIHLLPPPRSEGVEVEKWFGLRVEGIIIRGCKDLAETTRDPPRVTDHKTTKNLDYALSVERLATDLQAGVYAADEMVRRNSELCDVRWIYHPTAGKNRLPLVVETRLSRADVEPALERCVQAARRMGALRSAGISALEIPPNPAACGDYGGCDYRDRCGEFSPAERLAAKMGEQQSLDDFLATLPKRQAINPPSNSKEKETEAPPPPAEAAPKPKPAAKKPQRDTEPAPAPEPSAKRDLLLALARSLEEQAKALRAVAELA